MQTQLKTIDLHYDAPSELAILPLGPDVVAVNYILVQHTKFNGEPCTKTFRVGEVFRRESGRWKTVTTQETIVPGVPMAARVNRNAWPEYVGTYILFAGHRYRVTLDGWRLLWGNDDARRVELVQEDQSTFVINGGDHYRVCFERDVAGNVTHLRVIEYPGVEYSALKQPPAGSRSSRQ